MKNALSVSHLSVNYEKTPVLWDISLTVPEGKLVGIIGPNGAGKSTFIKAILNLIVPLSGKIEFRGLPFEKSKEKIAYVPQKDSVDWDFPITVLDLVLMGRYGRLGLFKKPRPADYESAFRCLELVGMHGFKDRQINQLSGGQKQRIFLARALIQDAEIFFLDEPFAGIDLASEALILNILKNLVKSGKTVFVVHHDLPQVESHFDWVLMLNMRLVAAGPVSEALNAETLQAAYGKNFHLLEDAMKLSEKKMKGLDP